MLITQPSHPSQEFKAQVAELRVSDQFLDALEVKAIPQNEILSWYQSAVQLQGRRGRKTVMFEWLAVANVVS